MPGPLRLLSVALAELLTAGAVSGALALTQLDAWLAHSRMLLTNSPRSGASPDVSPPRDIGTLKQDFRAVADRILRAPEGRRRIVPLQIRAAAGSDYYVKLVNRFDPTDVVIVCVAGKGTFHGQMPVGEYEMRFASGDDWYNEWRLFGQHTRYWVAEQTLSFQTDGNGPRRVAIDIAPQRGGRLRIRELDRDGF
jgi:hypothetical protein